MVGAIFENKKSSRAVKDWFFNTGQRNYTRKRVIWQCDDCSGASKATPSGGEPEIGAVGYAFLALLVFGFLYIFVLPKSENDISASTLNVADQQSTNLEALTVPAALCRVVGVASDDVLNIRTEPSSGAPIVGKFDYSERSIEVVGADPNSKWVLVRFDGGLGWVHGAYLERE